MTARYSRDQQLDGNLPVSFMVRVNDDGSFTSVLSECEADDNEAYALDVPCIVG